MIEQLLERKMAKFSYLMLGDPTNAVIRRKLVENFSRLAQCVGNRAVEIKDQCPNFIMQAGLSLA